MQKYKKCPCLKEENEIARCGAIEKLKENKGVFYCPKSRLQYKVTAVCWKVPASYEKELNR